MKDIEKKLIKTTQKICRSYCKYPDMYIEVYGDGQKADLECDAARCRNCPLMELTIWVNKGI